MIKTQRMHRSITEKGNFQGRIITQYKDENGTLISEKYGDPMEPADYGDLSDWDELTVDIITSVKAPAVEAAFGLEKAAENQHPDHKPKSGIFQSRSFDREIAEDGTIMIRRIDRIFDEGVEVSKKFHRSAIVPGADYSNHDVLSKAIAKKVHTQDVVEAYRDKMLASSDV